MNRRSKIILSVTGIFLVLLILIGFTYAYFITRINGNLNNTSILVSTANLEVSWINGSSNKIGSTEAIMPGKFTQTMDFKVENTGNSEAVYEVILTDYRVKWASTVTNTIEKEGVDTYLKYPEDMKMTITCKSYKTRKDGNYTEKDLSGECYGKVGTLPTTNEQLLSNKILEDLTHVYTITLEYVESGYDQSDDMNKEITGLIDIRAPKDGVDIEGYVANYMPGDIVQSNSIERISSIDKDGYYKILGLEFDDHTISLRNHTTVLASKSISIEKGTSSIINGSNITTTDEDRIINIDIDRKTGGVEIKDIKQNNPFKRQTFSYKILENSENVTEEQEETLGYAILRPTPLTKPAEEVNDVKESSLSLTVDDYGLSYYYRGNVKNNYVTFADMCWRIVRIAGDGSVKLILEDSDEPCSETINGNWAVPLNDAGTNYLGNFGYTEYSKNQLTASNGSKNSHTIILMDYLHSKTSSTIAMANALKKFQDSFTEIELSQLQSGNWCIVDNGYDDNGNLLNDTQVMDKIIGGDHVDYSSYVRLTTKVTAGYQPTLKCDGTKMDAWGDNSPMYVGTITADEVAYAGITTTKNNDYNYMINSEFKKGSSGMNKSLYFWTLSPYYFDYSDSYGYRVASTGRLNGATLTASYSIRPSIYLDSNVSIAGGTGVVGDAYLIK